MISFDDSELAPQFLGEQRTERPDVPLVVRLDIANYKVERYWLMGAVRETLYYSIL